MFQEMQGAVMRSFPDIHWTVYLPSVLSPLQNLLTPQTQGQRTEMSQIITPPDKPQIPKLGFKPLVMWLKPTSNR